jgi:hypothetical protein
MPSGGRLNRWLVEPVEADDRTGQQDEREPPPRISVPPQLQPPEAAQPRQRPLHPPAVPAKPGRGLHPTPGDPRPDPTPPKIGGVGAAVIPLVGVKLDGPGAPPPRRVRTAGTSSTTASNMVVSLTLAAVTAAVSGSPLPSQTRCSLLPGLPRSTGFAPTWSPHAWPARSSCPRSPGTSPTGPPSRAGRGP